MIHSIVVHHLVCIMRAMSDAQVKRRRRTEEHVLTINIYLYTGIYIILYIHVYGNIQAALHCSPHSWAARISKHVCIA